MFADTPPRKGRALEFHQPTTSPYFTPYIRSGSGSPLLSSFALSAQPNTLGLVAEEDNTLLPGIPIFPDNLFNSSPRSRNAPQISHYDYTTGWSMKPSGEYEYVAPGMIEEVDDDDEAVSAIGTDYTIHDGVTEASKPLPNDVPPPPTPDLRSRQLELLPEGFPSHSRFLPAFLRASLEALSSFTGTSSEPEELCSTFSVLRDDLSDASPRRDSLGELSVSGQTSPLRRAFSGITLSSPEHAASPAASTISQRNIIVSHNLELLQCAAAEMAAFQDVLQQQGRDFHLTTHINICQRVKAAITSVEESLRAIPLNDPNAWPGSPCDTYEKYNERLSSLQRTVTRLRSLVKHLNPPRLDDAILHSSVAKLEEHEIKLLNLAAKFKGIIKRQRVRQAQGQIAQAHKECYSANANMGGGGGLKEVRYHRRNSVISRRSSISGQGL